MQKLTKTDSQGRSVELDEGYVFINNREAISGQDEFFDWCSNRWLTSQWPTLDPNIFYRRKVGATIKTDTVVNKTITVSQEQFKQILERVCCDWKTKLAKDHYDFLWLTRKNIELSQINEYLKNAAGKLAVEIKAILKMEDFKVGELVLCRMLNISKTLELRFYAGNGEVYSNQEKSGNNKTTPCQILKFDLNNLPPELRNESN